MLAKTCKTLGIKQPLAFHVIPTEGRGSVSMEGGTKSKNHNKTAFEAIDTLGQGLGMTYLQKPAK